MIKLHVLFLSAVLGLTLAMPTMPQELTPTAETPFDRVMEIQDFFKNPDNLVKIQFPGSETLYVWQHMSQFYPTNGWLQSSMMMPISRTFFSASMRLLTFSFL
jgi:hypothetical protein